MQQRVLRRGVEALENRQYFAQPTVIDVLALYSPGAVNVNASSVAGEAVRRTQAAIIDSFNFMNEALANTGVPLTMRLVGLQQYNFTENVNNQSADLQLLKTGAGAFSGVPALRNSLGADLVVAFGGGYLEATGSFGEASEILGDGSPLATSGFAMMDISGSSYGENTVAHEIGHLLGAGHSRLTNGGTVTGPGVGPAFTAYGYGFDSQGTVSFSDTMSYGYIVRPNAVFVPYYSNPAKSFNGVPLGIAAGNPGESDLFTTFSQTGPILAGYRPTATGVTPVNGLVPTATLAEKSFNGSSLFVTIRYQDDIAVDPATIGTGDLIVTDGLGNVQTVKAVTTRYGTGTAIEYATYEIDLVANGAAVGVDPSSYQVSLASGAVGDYDGGVSTTTTLAFSTMDTTGGSPFTNTLGLSRDLSRQGWLSFSESVSGYFEDYADDFRFTVSAAGTYTFTIDNVSSTGAADPDVTMSLISDLNNNYKADSGETSNRVSVTSTGGSASFTVDLAPGSYYIEVTSNTTLINYYTVTATVPGSQVVAPTIVTGSGYTVAEGDSLALSAAGTTGGGLLTVSSYAWDFDGDGEVDATGISPVYSPVLANGPGTTFITLTVTNSLGGVSITQIPVTVINAAPQVASVTPATAFEGSTQTVELSFTLIDSTADLAAMRFDFDVDGDGIFEINGATTPIISIPGSLLVNGPSSLVVHVRATDPDGASTTFDVPVVVENVAPTGTISVPSSAGEGQDLSFTITNIVDSPSDLAAGLTYSFDFDNDGTFDFVSSLPEATIPGTLLIGPSTQTIRVRITDQDNDSTDLLANVQIVNVAPTVTINVPDTLFLTSNAPLDGVATDTTQEDIDAGFTFFWIVKFNGEVIGTNTTEDWSFAPVIPGDYTFELRATDHDGATGTVTKVIHFAEQPPALTITPQGDIREGGIATFVLTLSTAARSPVLVDYAASFAAGLTSGGGKTSGTVLFQPGQTSVTIQIAVADNQVRDTNGAVTLSLSNLRNVTVANPTSQVLVADDDVVPTLPPGSGILTISGTEFDDNVQILLGARKKTINFFVNGQLKATYPLLSQIKVDLGAGNDTLVIDPKLKVSTIVFGGDGDDSISGGSGRDILIGGAGRDSLRGGKGDNLLIADGVSFAAGSEQADVLLATWSGAGSSKNRFAALQVSGAPLADGGIINDADLDRLDVLGKSDYRLFGGRDQVFKSRGKSSIQLLA